LTIENSNGNGITTYTDGTSFGNLDYLCSGFACPAAVQSSYYVEICSDAACGTVVQNIVWFPSSAESYTPPATILVPLTSYWYRVKVRAYPFGYPALVSETDFTGTHAFVANRICAPGEGIGIGENLIVDVTSCNRANFSWTDNCPLEASFTVQKKNSDMVSAWEDVCVVGQNVTNCNNQVLLDGVHWDFRLKTTNSSGSAYSATVADETALCDPSNLTVSTVDCTKVRMSWDDNSLNETNYSTRWWNGSAWVNHVPDLASDSERRTVWQPTDTSRRYQVSAYNAAFQSAWVTAFPGTLGSTEEYCAPSNLKVDSYNCDCVNLSWTMSGDASAIVRYDIYKNINNRGWNLIGTAPGTALTYSDCTIVSNAQKIQYYVVAQNLGNVSNVVSLSGVCIKLPIWKESK